MQSGFTRALFLQVSIINCDRIQSHIYFTIFSHFHSFVSHNFFFDRSNCPYLIVRRPFPLTVRRLYVQSVTLILHLCIVSRSGSAARHHTFFLNASIYDVSSFLPSPLINSLLITCTCINDLHVFLYKLFLYSVQYSIVINGLIIQSCMSSCIRSGVIMTMIHNEEVHYFILLVDLLQSNLL
jgi:hypothetical protein